MPIPIIPKQPFDRDDAVRAFERAVQAENAYWAALDALSNAMCGYDGFTSDVPFKQSLEETDMDELLDNARAWALEQDGPDDNSCDGSGE